MHLTIFPKRVAWLLIIIALGLSLASIGSQFCLYFLDFKEFSAISRLFNVDAENNLPSFYGGFLLLFSSLLLAAISIAKKRSRDRYTLYWKGLSIIFFYLSIDEWFSVHEAINTFINHNLMATGGKQWDVLNSIGLVIFLVFYGKFFFHLPKQFKNLFLMSGTLFIFGALGIELIGTFFFSYIYGQPRFVSEIITTIEELLEMIGTTIFIYALLLQIVYLPINKLFIEVTDPYLGANQTKMLSK